MEVPKRPIASSTTPSPLFTVDTFYLCEEPSSIFVFSGDRLTAALSLPAQAGLIPSKRPLDWPERLSEGKNNLILKKYCCCSVPQSSVEILVFAPGASARLTARHFTELRGPRSKWHQLPSVSLCRLEQQPISIASDKVCEELSKRACLPQLEATTQAVTAGSTPRRRCSASGRSGRSCYIDGCCCTTVSAAPSPAGVLWEASAS